MTTLKILLILLIAQLQNCYGQSINADSLLNRFRNDIQIEQRIYWGKVKMDVETMESYYTLLNCASVNNLIKYTNDSNAAIRSYMFSASVQRKVKKHLLLQILDSHKDDTAKFTTKSGDAVIDWTVKYFMQTYINSKPRSKFNNINYKKVIEKIKKRDAFPLKINGIRHGIVKKEELLKIDSLVLAKNKFRIVSFTLFLSDETYYSTSNILTDEMKAAIKKAKVGAVFSMNEIKVAIEENEIRNIDSISLILE